MVSARVRTILAATTLAALAACSSPAAPKPSEPAATPPQPPHSELPSPDAPTQPPAGSVTAAALPTAADIVGRVPGAWTETATTAGSPDRPFSSCQLSKWESLGAQSVQTREYAGPAGTKAGAAALSFDTAARAQEAAGTVTGWWQMCDQIVGSNGGTGFARPQPAAPLAVQGGEATFEEVTWAADAPRVEGHSLVVRGNRLLVVVLGDTQPGTRDPMSRTLQAALPRLGG